MSSKSNLPYKTHAELLQDETFLIWKLSPTAEMDEYWTNLQLKYPSLKNEISLADIYLKENLFPKRVLKEANKELFLKRIYQANELKKQRKQKRKKVIINWIRYGAVVCILGLIGVTLLLTISNKENQESILVSELETKDIQLITGEKTTTFSESVNIQINEHGVAEIQDDDENKQEITFDSEKWNKLIVPFGKRSKIELSDGTKVWLNSGSTLEFPSIFKNNTRKIQLITGEMYIEVTPNIKQPFYVQTSNFNVAVYGTKFNISAYDNQTQYVALLEGNVGVKKEGKDIYTLAPNELVVYKDTKFSKHKTDVSSYITWINGYIFFDEVPISEILEYVERYYNLSFNYSNATNLKEKTCNGKLYLSDNVDNLMKSIAILSNTVYKRENNIISITNKSK